MYLKYKIGDIVSGFTICNIRRDNRSKAIGEFVCFCGNKFSARVDHVSSKRIGSCGCNAKNNAFIHGYARVKKQFPEYICWASMKQRCGDPKHKSYKNYGGRGIGVCERWMHSFENFLEDMGNRPTKLHSVDRINVNGNYEPGNCRWATKKQQMRNMTTNRMLEFDNKIQCVSDWAEEVNIAATVISKRLARGWSINKSLTTEYN